MSSVRSVPGGKDENIPEGLPLYQSFGKPRPMALVPSLRTAPEVAEKTQKVSPAAGAGVLILAW